MEKLKEQILLLEEQLELNQQSNDAKHILREIETIHSPISTIESNFKIILNYYQILQYLPEDAPSKMTFSIEAKEAIKHAMYSLELFSERWQKEGHESRQGNDLANLKSSSSALSSGCLSEIKVCWESWIRYLFSFVDLEDILLESQKNIPGMDGIYREFKVKMSQFKELIKKLPESSDAIFELQKLCDKMVKLKEKMQFDLPNEVSIFFKELDNLNREVSLALLTPEVSKWLQENKMLEKYVVSRKGQY